MKATHILIPMLSSFNIGRRRRYHVPSTARRKTFVLCYLLCIWPSMNPSVICEFAFCLSLFSFYFKKMNMLVSRKTQNGNGFHKLTSFSKRASKWRKKVPFDSWSPQRQDKQQTKQNTHTHTSKLEEPPQHVFCNRML